ncbi:MAG: hypothetical protein JNK58_03355 [Phycisphaerae bacterium]|nr:hypothetical protein [Phycisphaerae bacterium]
MYHVAGETQLRVVDRYLRQPENAPLFERTRLVILEHILPTTFEFVRLLQSRGVEIAALIAKPYSVHEETFTRFVRELGIQPVRFADYAELEASGHIEQSVTNALEKSVLDGRRVVLVDVGGYFAPSLTRLSAEQTKHLAGVIEDTTFGHKIYEKRCQEIPVPICSVARSNLKEIEARFVGRDAVVAMENLLRKIGISITGRNALVIGYGMIGKNVAWTLKSYGLNVYVYDIQDRKLLEAFNDGFHVHKKSILLRDADIIFSATGSEAEYGRSAMSLSEIEDCKHGVILASVGSRDTEFAFRDLVSHAGSGEELIAGD